MSDNEAPPEPKLELEGNAPISVKVMACTGEEVFFKIRRSTKLITLQGAYANKVGKDMNSICFLYDGQRIQEDDTPVTLGMEEDHAIDVMVDCIDAALSVLRIIVEVHAPSGYLRYAANGRFVFAAFASAYLLKVLRPPFVAIIEPEHQSHILALVNRVIKTLASPEVAVDYHHTPKLYSRFPDGAVPASEKRPMLPTIQVQAPDEELPTARSISSMEAVQGNQPHLLGGESMYRDDTYAYSTTASSTIDAQTRNTATQYSNEDILMQGDEDWIATMDALDNLAFWTNGMLPGFQWPSPPEGT